MIEEIKIRNARNAQDIYILWSHNQHRLAPGTYSTGPGLPRAGGLTIWPGAPRASLGPPGPKKKLFWICRR